MLELKSLNSETGVTAKGFIFANPFEDGMLVLMKLMTNFYSG